MTTKKNLMAIALVSGILALSACTKKDQSEATSGNTTTTGDAVTTESGTTTEAAPEASPAPAESPAAQ